MENQKQKKLEWDDLSREGRNCLLWPDFLEWGPEIIIDVKKASEDDTLGIITIAMQSSETKTCFHIVKKVREGRLPDGSVKQFDWITAVNGTPTTRVKESKEMVELTKNSEFNVRLTIRRAVDPLKNIKQWTSKERDVTLEVCSKDVGFRFSHFYSKVKNDNKDRILVFEIGPGKDGKSKTNNQLTRGDELLSVNGQDLTGKKLNDIYGLFFKSKKVEIRISRILHGKAYQEQLGTVAVKHPEQIYWMHDKKEATFGASQDSTCGLRFRSVPKGHSEFFHIVSNVTKGMPAFEANVCLGASLLSVNGVDITRWDKNGAADLMSKNKDELKLVMAVPGGLKQPQMPRKRRSSSTKNDSSSSSTHSSSASPEDPCTSEKSNYTCCSPNQSLLTGTTGSVTNKTKMKQCRACTLAKKSNEGFESSHDELELDIPKALGEAPKNGIVDQPLCKTCQKNETEKTLKRLPADKLQWPLKYIDVLAYEKICNNFELPDPISNMKHVAAHLGFPRVEIERIIDRYSESGGQGAAHVFLRRWEEIDPQNHDVGQLRKILQDEEHQRTSAVLLIDDWLGQDNNCFGCGAII